MGKLFSGLLHSILILCNKLLNSQMNSTRTT